MIAKVSGVVSFVGSRYAVVEAGGVGYKIYASAETLRNLSAGAEASLWTHLSVKENALDLYGFFHMAELEFFEMLISISGVGPKSALGILSVAPLDTLKRAIGSGDISYLTKVSGIGKKNAEKIVLELKDAVGGGDGAGVSEKEAEAFAALEALGYKASDIRRALREAAGETAEELVRASLRILGKEKK